MNKEMAKTYSPKEFEDRIYKEWEDGGYFEAHVDKDKTPFTIMMPPPNVTGNLHMGHALVNTMQDILIRWKRMEGYSALWLPGTDHASISTEARVVAKIEAEGKTKYDLGRDEFLKEAWEWTDEYGGNIRNQLRKLGVSCDWSKERFTLDEGLSEAVEEVFIRLYEKGLIYRGDRIINWCISCGTAISDAEVEHEESEGKIWHIRYPVVGSDESVIIATTRPETMLGDLAVAVNPEDERYTHLVGKKLLLPLMNKEIPVIADSYVEMDFGTGAVKITPSHDPNDFEVGERHDLGQMKIMNDKGEINSKGGKYEGLERYEARRQIIEDLESEGLLVEIKDHTNNVGHCERCNTVVEPIISKQWFVAMESMAKPALDALKSGELKFIPERFGKTYIHWLENIRDWCISRQLWWGHRLPVFYCVDCDEVIVSRDETKHCSKCGSSNIKQDPDTLDTWFSSALWPFSTLGWPEKTEELDYFYPTDVLVTGYDIIFFWVVRMVFSGIEQMGEIPFKDVLINGLVRDAEGKKMSKSLGNGIDPLDVIDEFGADALRFMLITGNSPGNDMRFHAEKVEASRNFANKLWNASRFVLMNLEGEIKDFDDIKDSLNQEDKWIVSRLNNLISESKENLEKYELGLAAQKVYEFTWNEYCDWYIELAKPRLYGEDEAQKDIAKSVLLKVLKDVLKLLHPFMPYITEEIWAHLPNKTEELIVAAWPQYDETLEYSKEVKAMEFTMESIKSVRNIRAEMNVIPSKKAKIIFVTKDSDLKDILESSEAYFTTLASASEIEVRVDKEGIGEDAMSAIVDKCEIFLPLEELVDLDKEIERLEKEQKKLDGELKRVKGKLSNEGFTSKAPQSVIDEEKEKQEKYQSMMDKVSERLENLKNK